VARQVAITNGPGGAGTRHDGGDTMADVIRRTATIAAALILCSTLPSFGQASPPGLCPADHPLPVGSPSASSTRTTRTDPGSRVAPASRPRPLGGAWTKLPRSPFAATNPLAVWAGERMVVMEPDQGRTATYDPARRRWKEHRALPSRPNRRDRFFEGLRTPVVAGDEAIVLAEYGSHDDYWYTWHAFDPATGRWRDVAPSPFERNGGGVSAWTGELLLAVSMDRSAAYDPVADCWLSMPDVPLPELPSNAFTARLDSWRVGSTHWTGDELLAVMVRDDTEGWTGIVSFDIATWEWRSRSLGPVEGLIVEPILVDGSLWFYSGDPAPVGLRRFDTSATYDPTTDAWSDLDLGCPLQTDRAMWTGALIIDPFFDRRAFDPGTRTCYRTPRVSDRARHHEPVWTGREIIAWSGAYGDTSRAFRDGIAYRLPRWALTDER
jgi:hypothetical protein